MPAIARLPSGTLVEVLCGQPEQKNGVRWVLTALPAPARSNNSSRDSRCSNSGARAPSRRNRASSAAAIIVGVSSPSLGSSGAPLLVALADHARAARSLHVVENADQLIFDEAALLLDDQDVAETFGEAARAALFQRPGQPDLVDAQA